MPASNRATMDLGNWLNGEIVCIWNDLAIRK
ncbi:hypothetical protein PMI10_01183 [Flavobacterium sp. CF136]|nr:hypothetical protein PMI10_01183 [Flavobacterium sp. CF136]